MEKKFVTNVEVLELAGQRACELNSCFVGPFKMYPIPRGGVPAAYALAAHLAIILEGRAGVEIVDTPEQANILVDDLIDSGSTHAAWTQRYPQCHFVSLLDKRSMVDAPWIVFPWERQYDNAEESELSVTDNVTRMLQYIGEDVRREGLKETPGRVVRAWSEWFSGYAQDPGKLFKAFTDGAQQSAGDEMIVGHNIPVYSHCEHHIAPMFGYAHIAYVPDKKILGLSKFDRIVDCFMRRLQVQERLTHQIADAFMEHLQPKGVGVILKCRHMCVESRGVRSHNRIATTSAMRGLMINNAHAKAEFVSLVNSMSGS